MKYTNKNILILGVCIYLKKKNYNNIKSWKKKKKKCTKTEINYKKLKKIFWTGALDEVD